VRLIDDLREGDLIQTRDDHMQPLCWIGRCTVAATGINTPIQIADGVLGNKGELVVFPNHRMLIVAAPADLLFGDNDVLVAAKHLVGDQGEKAGFNHQPEKFFSRRDIGQSIVRSSYVPLARV